MDVADESRRPPLHGACDCSNKIRGDEEEKREERKKSRRTHGHGSACRRICNRMLDDVVGLGLNRRSSRDRTVRTKNEQADGPALRPDGPRVRRID
jgi:hypothetical protein